MFRCPDGSPRRRRRRAVCYRRMTATGLVVSSQTDRKSIASLC